ncbi:MAG: thermonuclease family protein [Planctomycetia bacterium]|nr:thermonuclease family protein [Planctomycetia bacterium]
MVQKKIFHTRTTIRPFLNSRMIKLFALFFFLFHSAGVHAETIQGVVVKVYDGDTISIITPNMEECCIRLQAVDAPEKDQPGYREAQIFLAKLLHGQTVHCVIDKLDKFNRTVGRLYLGETDVEYRLIRAGMAWHYEYYNQEEKLAQAQKKAQAQKIGIWKQKNPIPPYQWRKMQEEKLLPEIQNFRNTP